MNSEPSVAENLAPAGTCAVAIRLLPTIPLDVIEEILHRVARDPDSILTIRSCSLISKSWVTPSQQRLFHTVSFIKGDTVKWLQAFPMSEWSPAHHVRDLHFSLGGQYRVPDEFLGVAQWFTNLRKLTVSGKDVLLRAVGARRVIARFQEPQPLAPNTVTATLLQVRDFMKHIPNLNDLTLVGSFGTMGRSSSQGIGTVLRGGIRRATATPHYVSLRLEGRHGYAARSSD